MRSDLEDKLLNDFPLLYRGAKEGVHRNLMSLGFCCGDGWFDLIYKLSEKLERVIEVYAADPSAPLVCECGHQYHEHATDSHHSRCLVEWREALQLRTPTSVLCPDWGRPGSLKKKLLSTCRLLNFKIRIYINRLLAALFNVTFSLLGRKSSCTCKQFTRRLPKAVQVKEKFGSLRFYVQYSTDEIEDLIDQAVIESLHTCEVCGAEARLEHSSDGYFRATLCKAHLQK